MIDLAILAIFATSFMAWAIGACALLASSRRDRSVSRFSTSLFAVAGTALLFCGIITLAAETMTLAVVNLDHAFIRALSAPWAAAVALPASLSLLHMRRYEPAQYAVIEAGGALAAITAFAIAPHSTALHIAIAGLAVSCVLARGLDYATRKRLAKVTKRLNPIPTELKPHVEIHDFTPSNVITLPRGDLDRPNRQLG